MEEEEDMTVMDATEEGPSSFFCMVVGIADKGWSRGGRSSGTPTTINRTSVPWGRFRHNESGTRLFV
jgi:hypothetical protein